MHSNTATNHHPHPTHHQRRLQPHLAVAKRLPRGNVVHTRLVRGHDDGIEGEDDGVENAEDQGLYEGVDGVEVGFAHEVPGEHGDEDVREEGDADAEEEVDAGGFNKC